MSKRKQPVSSSNSDSYQTMSKRKQPRTTNIDEEIIDLIKLLTNESYESFTDMQKDMIKKYFDYRCLFDFQDRIPIKQKEISQAKSDNISFQQAIYGKKPFCNYGEKCFRTNEKHKKKFLHYDEKTIKLIQFKEKELSYLKKYKKIHYLLLKKYNNNNIDSIIIEKAKIFTDFLIDSFNHLNNNDFEILVTKLRDFEIPISNSIDKFKTIYGLECPTFALLMTFILNIDNEKYKVNKYSFLLSLLDQSGVSGTYKKELIEKKFKDVFDLYIEKIYNHNNTVLDSNTIAVNTLAYFLSNLDDTTNSFGKKKKTKKRKKKKIKTIKKPKIKKPKIKKGRIITKKMKKKLIKK